MQASTTRGLVRGHTITRADDSVIAFLGVPFAHADRFAPPGPARAWTGMREADRFGPLPPQNPDPLSAFLAIASPGPQREDCLSINVWTPAVDDGRRPVMVWIHGGAFISGASAGPVYDGAQLCARGDVVVVTFNYRVGALGYLHLDGDHGGPRCTNLGLQDQIAALAWVRANIAAFGGDPGQVTVFGNSAGAGSLCALLAAPAARGLIDRAIVQSAAPDGFLELDEARERSDRLLRELDIEAAALPEVPLQTLLHAQQVCASEKQWKTGMFFTPVIDGAILPARPMAAIRDGAASSIPLMIGSNRDELQLYKLAQPATDLPPEAVEAAFAQVFGEHAQAVLEGFRSARAARGESLAGSDLVFALHTELAMRGPAIRLAEHHARHSTQTFMYLFAQPSPAQDGRLGCCHALEIPFVLGNLDVPGVAAYAGRGDVPQRISAQMMHAWIEFARTGRPSSAWPTYETGARATMVFSADSSIENAPREPERLALAPVVAATTP